MVEVVRLSRLDRLRLAIFGLTLLAICLLAARVGAPPLYERLGYALDDWRQTHTLLATPDTRVVLVDIDEHSIEAVGPWPWPRALIAQLVRTLFTQYGTRPVGLDILFPEASQPDDDAALLDVARHYPLVFAQTFSFATTDHPPRVGQIGGALAVREPAGPMPVASGFVGNFFSEPGLCVGHVSPHTDPDGVVRDVAPLIRYGDHVYPMFAWQLLACGSGGKRAATPPDPAALPGVADGLFHVPFRRTAATYDVVPAVDVLAGKAPASLLRGRYVVVGSSALGLNDHIAAPIDPWLPAMVVHAELLDALLDLTDAAPTASHLAFARWLPLAWAVVTLALLAGLSRLRRAALTLPVAAATTALWLAALLWLRELPADQIALPLVPAFVFVFVQAPLEWIASLVAMRAFERRFSQYLPQSVLRHIMRRADQNALKPQRRQITVLFADIEGYTMLAEQMPPEQLVAMTEVVLTRLTQCVYDTEGTLDKYMGDALMAFWGAPLEQPDHARRALDCAQAMLREVAAINREATALPHGRALRVRIGVNSGSAMTGELGSTSRQSYTVIGDAVNVAARLQEYARTAKTDLLVGQETARLAAGYPLKMVSEVTLRGREAPERLFVLDEAEAMLDAVC
ncbi:CHASE2 domain-containing protein [Paraburkholderia unamae]|uniref:Adenylate cyclase n=1 Tax=Paraburkholderia unamae TaxID=219649 RepID=A0ABX5KJX4_9BURK|nr:adenylate/guanylate cyclase domain-containing protein [Paraburkholderia unamae]PVX82162.1 adenylate cyclase [Paraburkholderia unamae]RAR60492.1 adenylate cyclase [Paraburkholderia unamae]CAG9261050.1 Adenylate cyclase [Paraburkholderia unamae]